MLAADVTVGCHVIDEQVCSGSRCLCVCIGAIAASLHLLKNDLPNVYHDQGNLWDRDRGKGSKGCGKARRMHLVDVMELALFPVRRLTRNVH
jgi:hypothetical protein